MLALGGEQLDERGGGGALGLLQLLDLALQMAHEHVDVAPAAERAAEPVQLVAQRLRPGRVEHRARGTQDRPRPSHRHADAVHVLGIEVEPDAGVVAQDLGVLPLEHRAQPPDRVVGGVHPSVGVRGVVALGVRPAQERRQDAGDVGRRRDGPAELLDDERFALVAGELQAPDAFPVLEAARERGAHELEPALGQVVVRDLGSPVLGHVRMLTPKRTREGRRRPSRRCGASQGRGGGDASRCVPCGEVRRRRRLGVSGFTETSPRRRVVRPAPPSIVATTCTSASSSGSQASGSRSSTTRSAR